MLKLYSIFLVHGLGSHPYYSWLHEPSPRLNRSSSAPGLCDSTISLIPSGYKFLRLSPTAEDGQERAALLSSPDLTWQNEYSATDFFGRIGTFWPRDLLQLDAPDVRICKISKSGRIIFNLRPQRDTSLGYMLTLESFGI